MGDQPPELVLEDFVDGWNANVYQIGCEQPPTPPGSLVHDGNFEAVSTLRPTQLSAAPGPAWHVYMPDGPGYTCRAAVRRCFSVSLMFLSRFAGDSRPTLPRADGDGRAAMYTV